MLPFCEDDLPREVCQAQVRNITCFMHKQLPGEFKLLEESWQDEPSPRCIHFQNKYIRAGPRLRTVW